MNAWVRPDGTYHPCAFGGHELAAFQIVHENEELMERSREMATDLGASEDAEQMFSFYPVVLEFAGWTRVSEEEEPVLRPQSTGSSSVYRDALQACEQTAERAGIGGGFVHEYNRLRLWARHWLEAWESAQADEDAERAEDMRTRFLAAMNKLTVAVGSRMERV